MASISSRRVYLVAALAAAFGAPAPLAIADSEIKQSPLLMRRAGPSCQPGHLGGDPNAGYRYQLGPCAAADAPPRADPSGSGPPQTRRRHRER